MRRRLTALCLALTALLGLVFLAAAPAAADDPPDGWLDGGFESLCDWTVTPVIDNVIPGGPSDEEHEEFCDKLGDAQAKEIKKAWNAVWNSVLGDVIRSGADVVKWIIKKTLTYALTTPSVDLEGTGLFGRDATLAGMLTWLGVVIAAAGAMWQIGKGALTGQTKHVGRAMLGWVEQTILSAAGVGLVALLLVAGDALTTGLIDKTFADDGAAYERIVAVMVPVGVANPVTLLCIVAVLLLIGFIQMVMIFLRQSAIPIQCLLLPVAAGGRVGGDATRQWAPRLITSICVVITYKPILAVIVCTGFAEFGHAKSLTEWLRGCATLVLAILAPGPLTKVFAPFGEAVGSGMAAGGASGALAGAAGYFMAKKGGGDDASSAPVAAPAPLLEHVQRVEKSMGSQGGGGAGRDGEAGKDAQTQAARNEANRVPGQTSAGQAGDQAAQAAGTAAGATKAAAAGTAATGAGAGVGLAIQVLDGVNQGVQSASNEIGNGGGQR
ncbi:hypothetical protein [Streptomyces sp. NPDC053367]|uniref:hypothetical protein n=1 Tax=Streptomyces sp. NPDC053367 TaxID=3365700 RepID=UPI0037D68CCB